MQERQGQLSAIAVAMYLIGDQLDFAHLGSQFEITPIVAVPRGSPRLRPHTGEVVGVHANSVWGFSSAAVVSSNEIEEHSKWLLVHVGKGVGFLRANPHLRVFLEITQTGLLSFSCVLPKALVQFASEFNADIGFVSKHASAAA